jgi:RNA polymerase sigma-70 factor (ECF subfamily)
VGNREAFVLEIGSQTGMTDGERVNSLILAVASQDRGAFRQLYEVTSAKLMGVLIRILGTRAEAEDALQEVFIRVWIRAGQFDAIKATGMTWLIAVARNCAIDRLRSRPNHISDDMAVEAATDTSPRAETRVMALCEARRIGACFDMLEPCCAAALRGAYLEGRSYRDLAAYFDVPLNTMRTRLRRSLRKVKACMEA